VWFFPLLNEKAELLPVAPKKMHPTNPMQKILSLQEK
jgi:hypothetical protein